MSNMVVSLYLGLTWQDVLRYRDIMLNKSDKEIKEGNCFTRAVNADTYFVELSLVDRVTDNSGLVSPVVTISVRTGGVEVAKDTFTGTGLKFDVHTEDSICRLFVLQQGSDVTYHVNVNIVDDTM